jgi:hypothetical protein
MFKVIRIFILLSILAIVGFSNYRARVESVEWKYTLLVNIYPINGDGSPAAEDYLRNLTVEEFKPIEDFMRKAADQYGKAGSAGVEMRLQPRLQEGPPAPPEAQSGLPVMWWSLKFRWWAYRHAKVIGPGPQVRLFVQYFDPHKAQSHSSTALQQGLIGRVNVFASKEMRAKNNFVIAHELLHTLGATDKYDRSNDMPSFPDGYGEPERAPLLPQRYAEIMGGRIALSASDAVIPSDFKQVVMGVKTAQEINFLPRPESD